MKPFLTTCLLFLMFSLNAQDDFEPATTIPELQQQLLSMVPDEILVGRNTIEQSVEFGDQPYDLVLTQIEQGRKTKESRFEINLAFVNRVFSAEEERDGIRVKMSSGNMASFKLEEDGDLKGYKKDCAVIASDIENGRAIYKILDALQPLAEAAWEAQINIPEDVSGLQDFLKNQVTSFSSGDDGYEQTLDFDGSDSGLANFAITEEGGRNGEVLYRFYFAHLNPSEVEVEVRGTDVELNLSTYSRNKYIEEVEEEDKSFINKMTIYFPSVEDGQTAAYAVRALIPVAKETYESQMPSFSATSAALEELNQLFSATDLTKYDQSIEPACLTTINEMDNSRSESEENRYTFDFSDLDSRKVELEPKGDAMAVSVETRNNRKYIGLISDGEQGNYDNDLLFYFESVLQAQRAQVAIEYLAKECPDETPAPDNSTMLGLLSVDNEDLEQEVNFSDECLCTVRQRAKSGREKEIIYEFNLFDLSAGSAEIDISGKKVEVVFETNRKEEIIQVREDAEEQTYTDEISLALPDLQSAKQIRSGFKQLIEACDN